MEKLKVATESTLSAEERAAQMDEFLNNEEKRQKDLYQDLKTLRDINFKKQEELHDAQRSEKDVESSIQVTRLIILQISWQYMPTLACWPRGNGNYFTHMYLQLKSIVWNVKEYICFEEYF